MVIKRGTTAAESGPISLRLANGLLDRIREHAEGGYPEEVCGGLLGAREAGGAVHVKDLVPVENARNQERSRRYLIGPEDVVRLEKAAEERGLAVVGYYHSHPDAAAIPSDFDREHAWPWYIYLIAAVRSAEMYDVRAWRLKDDRSVFEPVVTVSQ